MNPSGNNSVNPTPTLTVNQVTINNGLFQTVDNNCDITMSEEKASKRQRSNTGGATDTPTSNLSNLSDQMDNKSLEKPQKPSEPLKPQKDQDPPSVDTLITDICNDYTVMLKKLHSARIAKEKLSEYTHGNVPKSMRTKNPLIFNKDIIPQTMQQEMDQFEIEVQRKRLQFAIKLKEIEEKHWQTQIETQVLSKFKTQFNKMNQQMTEIPEELNFFAKAIKPRIGCSISLDESLERLFEKMRIITNSHKMAQQKMKEKKLLALQKMAKANEDIDASKTKSVYELVTREIEKRIDQKLKQKKPTTPPKATAPQKPEQRRKPQEPHKPQKATKTQKPANNDASIKQNTDNSKNRGRKPSSGKSTEQQKGRGYKEKKKKVRFDTNSSSNGQDESHFRRSRTK